MGWLSLKSRAPAPERKIASAAAKAALQMVPQTERVERIPATVGRENLPAETESPTPESRVVCGGPLVV